MNIYSDKYLISKTIIIECKMYNYPIYNVHFNCSRGCTDGVVLSIVIGVYNTLRPAM